MRRRRVHVRGSLARHGLELAQSRGEGQGLAADLTARPVRAELAGSGHGHLDEDGGGTDLSPFDVGDHVREELVTTT